MFIELTAKSHGKFMANLEKIEKVFVNKNESVFITSSDGDSLTEVEEDYEEVIRRISLITKIYRPF